MSKFIFTASFLYATGCAHYYLPATHFLTPEVGRVLSVHGKPKDEAHAPDFFVGRHLPKLGELEWLSIQSGHDLTDPPVWSAPDAESGEPSEPYLQKSWGQVAFSLTRPIFERTSLSVRLQTAAPLLFTLKHQIAGASSFGAESGNFPISVGGSGGVLLGSQGGSSTSYLLLEGFLSAGYRFNQKNLLWLSPFFSLASLSGVTGISSSTANQFGAALGFQYSSDALFLRAEGDWVSGSMGSSKISGILGGVSVGFEI